MAWLARTGVWRLALGLALASTASAQAAGGLTLLAEQPLPMAVRDRGVALVTVRAITFALAGASLDGPTVAALDAYLATIATDCFLFAQAVGHARPGPDGDGDMLTAHRLARARAETVGAALRRAGLPADAITSVWDRQFATREPRATLWVFAHPAGDDCAGAPLPGASAQVVAAIPAAQPAASPSPPALSAAVAPADREPAPGIHLPDEASRPAAGVASARPTTGTGDAAPAAGAIVAAPAPDRVAAPPVPFERVASVAPPPPPEAAAPAQPTDVRAPDIAEMQPPADLTFRAAAVATEPQAGPVTSAPAVPAKATPAPALAEIAFAPDSSDLPADALVRLEALVAALPREAAWEVELQAAVGDGAGRLSAERALAYNRWLAEQRQGRVEEWLGTHPRAPVLRVRRSLLPHDPSRRLVISARPLP